MYMYVCMCVSSLTHDVGGLGMDDGVLKVVHNAEPVDAANAQPAREEEEEEVRGARQDEGGSRHYRTTRHSQVAVLGNGQGGDRDVGEEREAEEWLVARAALHAVRSHFQGGLPVAAALAGVITHDGDTDQLRVCVCA